MSVIGRCIYDFVPEGNDELACKNGELLTILNSDHPEWLEAELNGAQGWIPRTYVKLFEEKPVKAAETQPVSTQRIITRTFEGKPMPKNSLPGMTRLMETLSLPSPEKPKVVGRSNLRESYTTSIHVTPTPSPIVLRTLSSEKVDLQPLSPNPSGSSPGSTMQKLSSPSKWVHPERTLPGSSRSPVRRFTTPQQEQRSLTMTTSKDPRARSVDEMNATSPGKTTAAESIPTSPTGNIWDTHTLYSDTMTPATTATASSGTSTTASASAPNNKRSALSPSTPPGVTPSGREMGPQALLLRQFLEDIAGDQGKFYRDVQNAFARSEPAVSVRRPSTPERLSPPPETTRSLVINTAQSLQTSSTPSATTPFSPSAPTTMTNPGSECGFPSPMPTPDSRPVVSSPPSLIVGDRNRGMPGSLALPSV